MIDFIGIGAQKAGTSWIYACLYEHPEICAPVKEIHFFSRDRFANGREWYEEHFKKCSKGKQRGEFSTSYLYSPQAADRIHAFYPHVKIIAVLRNPMTRANSQYGNAIKAGEISESVTFGEYMKNEPSVLEQGLYANQLSRYIAHFDPTQLHIAIYEDAKEDPKKFIQAIYEFLGVQKDFVPSMLFDEVNVSRVPKSINLERWMHQCAEYLRRKGLDSFVHMVRRLGLPNLVRMFNTKEKETIIEMLPVSMREYFETDTRELSKLLHRDVAKEWGITT